MRWIRLVYDTHNHLRHAEEAVPDHKHLLEVFRKQIGAAKFNAQKRRRARATRRGAPVIPEVSGSDTGAVSSDSDSDRVAMQTCLTLRCLSLIGLQQ